VVVVEGEKCADAAEAVFPDSVVMTSSGGSEAADQTDWSTLAGRKQVIIWPDADEPGRKYAKQMAATLHKLAIADIQIIDAIALAGRTHDGGTREPPPGWDVGDAIEEGWKSEALRRVALECAEPWTPNNENLINELARLDDIAYDKQRREAAKRLDIGVRVLDKEVRRRRIELESAAEQPQPEAKVGSEPGYEMKATGLFHGDDWLSAPFEILGRARDPNGQGWARWIKWKDPDGCEHTFAVSDAKLHGESSALCAELAQQGFKITTSAVKRALLIAYLNHADSEKRVMTVDRTGWCDLHGSKVFVLPDRTIGDTGDETVKLTSARSSPYSARGTLEGWRESIGKLTDGHDRAMFAVSTALSSTLAELVGLEGGGVNFYGRSSTGKTSIAKGAASVWGHGDDFIRTWRATANSLEGAAVLHNDIQLILDELGVAEAAEVSSVVYTLAGGTGKGRAARDGAARELRRWRTLILSTGELRVLDKIVEGGRRARAGQEVRIVDIDADAGRGFGVFDNAGPHNDAKRLADDIKAAARTHYGVAGPAFVERLIEEGSAKSSIVCRTQSQSSEAAMFPVVLTVRYCASPIASA
jgi:putative DNA primase/helicase